MSKEDLDKLSFKELRDKVFWIERNRDALFLTMKKNKKRIKELEEQVEKLKKKQQETFKVFRATHKTKYELIKELEEEKTRVKELEEQLAHSYDSGLEAVHQEDPRDYPEEYSE